MYDDEIRIRIPKHLKRQFKAANSHGKMTDLLKAVVLTALEGVNLVKLAKKAPKQPKPEVRGRIKPQKKVHSDSYIRFLIDQDTKERFKLFCHLKGTTMSNFLREAVEEILLSEQDLPTLPQPKTRQLAIAHRQPVDIGRMWSQAFGDLSA
jgi:antitoxin component of RelBE/YafQ-DinJ toxin-antitoxin module